MLERWIRTVCAVCVLLAAVALPAAADDSADFTVSDVHVDVTAASALAARDKAQADGQAQAFDTLMTRLGSAKPRLTSAQITDLVQGFEVSHERTSTVRYVADVTYHFNPAAVRRILSSAPAMATAEPLKRPLIVLPVILDRDGRVDLWDDPNPWRDAWVANARKQGLVKLTVPDGDLPDIAAIDAPKALAGDRAAIKAISARYNNGDVLVVQGKFGPPGQFDMQVARYTPDDAAPPATLQLMTTAKPGESEPQQLARSVGYVAWKVAQWKPSTPVAAATTAAPAAPTGGGSGTIDASLMSGSLADWVMVRNRLRDIPGVRGAELMSFDRSAIRIAIRYAGDPTQLRTALGEHGLDLTGTAPDWTLAIRAEPLTAKLPSGAPPASPAAVPAPPDAAGSPDAAAQSPIIRETGPESGSGEPPGADE